jgi:MFS family permease
VSPRSSDPTRPWGAVPGTSFDMRPSASGLGPVFVLSGVHLAAIHVSARTILLEFTDDLDERPTYIGLATSALAPLSFAGPLAAGAIADRLGFLTVSWVAATFGLVGLALLLARVREPRQARDKRPHPDCQAGRDRGPRHEDRCVVACSAGRLRGRHTPADLEASREAGRTPTRWSARRPGPR